MDDPNVFIQTGRDIVESTELLLELILIQLEKKFQEMKQGEISELGQGFEDVVRPWALIFMKSGGGYQTLLDMVRKQHEKSIWFDSIQVCRIDTIHQLRGVLCALHVKETSEETSAVLKSGSLSDIHQQSNILNYIIEEKDNQPPCLIVVVDLIDLLIYTTLKDEDKLQDFNKLNPIRYLHVQHNELNRILANLIESCAYQSEEAKRTWENELGVKMIHKTQLMITDRGCLPPKGLVDTFEGHKKTYTKKIFKSLDRYMDLLV